MQNGRIARTRGGVGTSNPPRVAVLIVAGLVGWVTASAAQHEAKANDPVAPAPTLANGTAGQAPGTSSADGAVSAPEGAVTLEDGVTAYRNGDYAAAEMLFERYLERNPEATHARYMHGMAAWKAGHLDVAEAALRASVERDPEHAGSRLNLVRVLLARDKTADALNEVNAAIGSGERDAEAYRLLGRAYHESNQPREAVRAYQKALGLDAADGWSMNNLGLVHLQEERYDEALPALARAAEILPGEAVVLNNLGVALERSGHATAAADAYRRAVELDGAHATAAASLARVAGRKAASGPAPDLAALADRFDAQIRDGFSQSVALQPRVEGTPPESKEGSDRR